MTRLFCVFVVMVVVVAVVVVPSEARPHACEQKERSLADLDLAEDALTRARDLIPNCEEEMDFSNSSECSQKDKSLGYIDVALNLVSDAKKNFPVCPDVTTEEPLTTTTTEVTTTPTEVTTTPTEVTTIPTEGTTEDRRLMDCQEFFSEGSVKSGVYTVWLRGRAVRVRCDMETDGGGWTVIQRRGNFSKQENFDRDWKDYKNGFGSLEKDFWLGNDNIFALSNQGAYSLRMDMTAADGKSAYVVFREFRIKGDDSNYALHVDKYEGTAGDSMSYSNGQMFSTKDRKNDKSTIQNCAVSLKGGFWYNTCAKCSPNGMYKPGKYDDTALSYDSFKFNVGLLSMEMKMKRL